MFGAGPIMHDQATQNIPISPNAKGMTIGMLNQSMGHSLSSSMIHSEGSPNKSAKNRSPIEYLNQGSES